MIFSSMYFFFQFVLWLFFLFLLSMSFSFNSRPFAQSVGFFFSFTSFYIIHNFSVNILFIEIDLLMKKNCYPITQFSSPSFFHIACIFCRFSNDDYRYTAIAVVELWPLCWPHSTQRSAQPSLALSLSICFTRSLCVELIKVFLLCILSAWYFFNSIIFYYAILLFLRDCRALIFLV